MTREDQIRKELLFQLYALRPLTLDPDRIERDARKNGYDYARAEIQRELVFLADEGLLIKISEPGTTCVRYRIHAHGVRHYEEIYAA